MARKRKLRPRSPRRRVGDVGRSEFDALRDKVEECMHQLDVQFRRIAQLQADLDAVRAAWTRATTMDRRRR